MKPIVRLSGLKQPGTSTLTLPFDVRTNQKYDFITLILCKFGLFSKIPGSANKYFTVQFSLVNSNYFHSTN